ncbi:MAG: helix-turn-helix domain-containing protein [Gammaproteobacteria bacterium]
MAKGIQSVSLGFRLLRAITDSDAPAPLKTLAAAADMSPSKARMYLISLIETGLVAQNPQTGLYALGPYARHLGTRALQRMDGREPVYDSMRLLQRKTEALVLLCKWQESGIIIVAAEEGGEPHPLQWRIGGTASLASTATGAVFLAFGPQNIVWKRLAVELKEAGVSQAAQKKRIRELEVRAAEIRVSGVAEADPVVFAAGVTISGFAAIAVPVFDADEQLGSVLTLLYRTDRPHRKKGELLSQTLRAASVS